MKEFGGLAPKCHVLDHIAGRWTIPVVDAFLEGDGLLTRTVYPTIPPTVDYAVTTLGRRLAEPITVLRQWREDHINETERARARATPDGNEHPAR